MVTREQALTLIRERVKNENIVKHMLAVEAFMEALYDALKSRGKADEELGGSREEWALVGLLHDGDYCDEVSENMQGVQISKWVLEKGCEIPENVVRAMAAHNSATGVKPLSLMDWAIFIGDSLTGLIVATALVVPGKKLSDVTVESLLKKFKQKSFAAGTRREDILLCEEKLGLSLEEFMRVGLKSMQNISSELGL